MLSNMLLRRKCKWFHSWFLCTSERQLGILNRLKIEVAVYLGSLRKEGSLWQIPLLIRQSAKALHLEFICHCFMELIHHVNPSPELNPWDFVSKMPYAHWHTHSLVRINTHKSLCAHTLPLETCVLTQKSLKVALQHAFQIAGQLMDFWIQLQQLFLFVQTDNPLLFKLKMLLWYTFFGCKKNK